MALNMNEGFIVVSWRTGFTFCRSDDEGEHRSFRGNSSNFVPPREENVWMGLQPCATFAERLHRARIHSMKAGFTLRLPLSCA